MPASWCAARACWRRWGRWRTRSRCIRRGSASTPRGTSPFALSFAIPCGTPGLRFLCRESFDLGRSHFDHPLGSRFEEMDCVVFFDDVLVPWERVFLLGDVDRLNNTAQATHSSAHSAHQGAAKNLAKCEVVLGTALLMTETLGNAHLPHVEERLAELMTHTVAMRACMRAAEADAKLDQWGVMCPDIVPIETTRNLFMTAYPRMVEILQLLGSSSFMLTPTEKDLRGPLAPWIEQYLATETTAAPERIRLFHLAWDIACSLVRQPPGAVRAVLRLRPADARARAARDLSEAGGDRSACVTSCTPTTICDHDKGGRRHGLPTDASWPCQPLRAECGTFAQMVYGACWACTPTTTGPGWAAFLSADLEQSHEVALMQVGDDAPLQQKGQVGLNHLAWMMASLDDLKAAYWRLKEKGVKIDRIVDHGLSLGIYFRDPDGNGLEVSYELPREQWPRQEAVFAPDVVGLGRFPGPWDAEMKVQNSAARQQATAQSPRANLPLPLFAGEVGERSKPGEGGAYGTTLTRVASAPRPWSALRGQTRTHDVSALTPEPGGRAGCT